MASYAHDVTEPEFALGIVSDIVLRGREARRSRGRNEQKTPSQTVGPSTHRSTRQPMNVVASE